MEQIDLFFDLIKIASLLFVLNSFLFVFLIVHVNRKINELKKEGKTG